MASVEFTVPGAPRGKGSVRARKAGSFIQTYMSKEDRAEMLAVGMIARVAMAGRLPFTGPLELKLCAYTPIAKSWSKKQREAALAGEIFPTSKPDTSNIVKLCEDGMNAVVFTDDAQIVKLTAWKIYSSDPRVVIEVSEIAPG